MFSLIKKLRWVFIIWIIIGYQNPTHANTATAISSGNWSDATNWDCNSVPGCYDTIVIPAGIIMTGTSQVNLTACSSVCIIVEGEISFQTGFKLTLPCNSCVELNGSPGGWITGGTGGGNADWVKICGAVLWNSADGDLQGPAALCDPAILPIELHYFVATPTNNRVFLNWETLSESNNDYFTVEVSKDGKNWMPVLYAMGAGNSSRAVAYEEVDISPFPGMSYYRLKQTDYDGNSSYSDVVAVNRNELTTEIDIFPNPLYKGQEFNILIEQGDLDEAEVEILSLDGRVVYHQFYEYCSDELISVDHCLKPGVYLVMVNGFSKKITVR